MRDAIGSLTLIALLGLCGCQMCQSNLDHFYAAYGGERARADMVRGRVGSLFDPAVEVVPHDDTLMPVEDASRGTPGTSAPETLPSMEPQMEAPEELPNGPELSSPFPGSASRDEWDEFSESF